MPKKAFLFVMDSCSPSSIGAFDELNQSVKSDCFILFHQRFSEKIDPEILKRPHYIVTNESLSNLGYNIDTNKSLVPGNNHLPLIQFFKNKKYDYYWYIEYDVGFLGKWQNFFSYFDTAKEDFITSHIRFKFEEPSWVFWNSLVLQPKNNIKEKLRSFNPIYRISDKALNYIDQKQKEGLCGHHEVLLPTLLYNSGFSIRDFGGLGLFVKAEDKERFYVDSTSEKISDGSMRYRPNHIALLNKKTNILCHPVKNNKSFNLENWKTYYINLENRKDRRKNIEEEMLNQEIKAERFSALTDEDYDKFPNLKLGKFSIYSGSDKKIAPKEFVKGEWGCFFSHYSILKKHLDSKSENILAIFEDDAHFCSDFKERLKYLENNFNLDWDIFYLSSCIKLPYNKKTETKYIWKIEDTVYGTYAMLFNPKSISKILGMMELYAPNFSAVDMLYCHLIPLLKAYCFIPGMVSHNSQVPGNIGGRVKVLSNLVSEFGEHVFAEKLEDYNYKKTGTIKSRINLLLPGILGYFGKKIKSFSPKLYIKIKPYFPDKN